MKKLITAFTIIITIFVSGILIAEQSPLKCETGPVKKVYGNNNWLVYSCTDNKTLVIVSDTGSPAMPFYFTFYMKNGIYNLTGEGTGNKTATNAAYKELSKLSNSEIKKLIQKTRNIK